MSCEADVEKRLRVEASGKHSFFQEIGANDRVCLCTWPFTQDLDVFTLYRRRFRAGKCLRLILRYGMRWLGLEHHELLASHFSGSTWQAEGSGPTRGGKEAQGGFVSHERRQSH